MGGGAKKAAAAALSYPSSLPTDEKEGGYIQAINQAINYGRVCVFGFWGWVCADGSNRVSIARPGL